MFKKTTLSKLAKGSFAAAALIAGAYSFSNEGSTTSSASLTSFIKDANASSEGLLIGCAKDGGSCQVHVVGQGPMTLYGKKD
ncbi:hypothetical protein PQ465_04825 [Sphingobacterium oryzagri]|uniref:Uncharacterized protein n=1 Tax=Sphingobacterium oryzagri TaxID=3025669 RepID=A0ABY7WJF0_9SPHI|nr:hypothetical protein [Sphingobacterium sp. KACC 22765]WDF69706.1 hypothetical protein PQ465_04825 [Sphingobacterium sp. KACC 22765]